MDILMRFPGFKYKALTFSYDDGWRQDKRLVEIFNRYNVKGTFNINSGAFGENKSEDILSGKGRMSEEEAFECYSNGEHEVAVHAYTHPHLECLANGVTVAEIIRDRLKLEKIFGYPVRGMAYPFGTYNEKVIECLKACDIAYARTIATTGKFDLPQNWLCMPTTCHHSHSKLLEFADTFLSLTDNLGSKVKLFYVWGHTTEFDRDNNWHIIDSFIEKVSNNDDIWYATNIQICDYVKAYESLIWSADATMVYNPTATEVFFIRNRKKFSVKPGEKITTQ